ncbi:MAG: hypothetical protein CVU56_07690 [Deltaproteobacteria bacterium HGW-Deltaproteobacteria-14]|jgi:hypothetical protein|nr:MAG: hypothetical protein CVU56_07690 [Deltaproteobacteria bacterium HGW-Deltaproteobacteria-14]
MSTSRFRSLATTLTFVVAACGGDATQPPPDTSDTTSVDSAAPADTWVGADTATPADTVEPADTTAPVDTTPPPGVVTLALETANGETSEAELTFYPEDEPVAYADHGHPGFQLDVVVRTANIAAGELVALSIAGEAVASAPVAIGDDGAGSARFDAVTLPSGAGTIAVSVTDQRGDAIAAQIAATVVDAPCTVSLAMAEPTTCFTADADPDQDGFQAAVTITRTGGDCQGVTLSGIFGDAQWASPAYAFDGADSIAAVITLSAQERGVEGLATITAVAIHAHSAALDSFASMDRMLDTLAPAPRFVRPDPAELRITAAQDVDHDPSNGLQYDITVAAGAADVTNVALMVDGAAVDAGVPGAGVWTWSSYTFSQDGAASLAATATDACGNTGAASAGLDVYVMQPTIDLVAPSDGAVLLAKFDGDPSTTLEYEVGFDVWAADVKGGSHLTVSCQADASANPVVVASYTFDGDAVDAQLSLLASLDTTILGATPSCAAHIDGWNPASSGSHRLVIALPAPSIKLTAPADGARLNRRAITVRATAAGLDGRPLRVRVANADGDVFHDAEVGLVSGGAFEATVSGADAAFADGAYVVTVDGTDALGNVVSDTAAPAEAGISLDATAPTLVRVAPADDMVDPVADPTLVDKDPLTPGYQTTLTWRMDGENVAAGAIICPTVSGSALACKAPAADSFEASWTITLIPGTSTLAASGDDAWGNHADVASAEINLHLDAPAVTITAPINGLVTAAETVAVVVHVADPDNQAPIDGASVTLIVDGAASSTVPVALGDGDYRFGGVALTLGAVTTFQAVAAYSGEEGASAERNVRQKDTVPSLTIVSPLNDTVFNLASAACVGTQQDCVTDIVLAPSEIEVGQAISVTVTCDGLRYTANTPCPATGDVTFADITLPHGASCTIEAHGDDAAGQPADGGPVVVRVDRVAPRILSIVKPSGTTLTHIDDQKPGTPGMQSGLKLNVSGVEAGAEILASMAWSDEAGVAQSRTLTHPVAVATGDADTYSAVFVEPSVGSGLVQYPEGAVTVSFTVADAAGNTVSASRSITVETDAPAARITSPSWLGDATCSETALCASGICHQGQCYRGWGVVDSKLLVLDVAGLLTSTDNVRVCSDAVGVSAAAPSCASAGFHQVALVSAVNGVVIVDVSSLPEEPQRLVAEVRAQDGGAWTSSLAADAEAARRRLVYVDLTPPIVSQVSSPSDAEAPTGVLNIAEQEAAGRRYTIEVRANEDGPVTIYANGQSAATATVANGSASVQVALQEGTNSIYARVTDKVGNLSSAGTAPETVKYAPTVDTTPPTLAFTAPVASPIAAGGDRDVSLTSDADGRTVTVRDGATEVASQVVSDGVARFPHDPVGILADGSHTLTATVSDSAGNPRTVATTPATVVVDTAPPSVSIAAPADMTTFTAEDDPQPSTAAIEVDVAFVPADDAATWAVKTATCDASWVCGATITVASGTVPAQGQQIVRTVALQPYDAVSYYEVTVSVTDAVGNKASATTHATLVVQDCVVTIDGLGTGGYVGAAACGAGLGCPVTVTGAASGANCGAVDGLALVRREGASETVLGQSSTLSGGSAQFDVDMNDGDHFELVVQALVGSVVVAESAVVSRTVDLVAPTVSVTAVVAGTPPAPGLYNASNDDSAAAGYQVSVSVQASDDHLAGGAIERIVRKVGATQTEVSPTNVSLPLALNAQFANQMAEHVTLTDLADNTVTVHVRDAAGNVGTASFAASVDAVGPAPVALAAIAADDVDRHRPSVTLRWLAVGEDNGAGGPAAAYDVRYSRLPIADAATFEAACKATDIAHSDAIPAPSARGTSETVVVGGPDARGVADDCKLALSNDPSAWYFAVRAQDDAGNWGAVSEVSQTVTTALEWQVSHVRFTAAFQSATGLGATAVKFLGGAGANIGDVNGDTYPDFATGFFLSNAFCVVYGGALGADIDVDAASGPNHSCVIGTSSVVADATAKELGSFIDPLGDVNGDGYADFGVSGKTGGVDGFVAIYLGSPTGPDLSAPEVVVRGIDGLTGAYGGFCGAGNFDGAITPVATDDIAVGEPGSDRLRVIPGSTGWSPGQATIVIDLDAADVDATFGMQAFAAQFGEVAWFGNRCQRAGELLPTPSGGRVADDLLIHQAKNEDARVIIIPGRPLTPGITGVLTKLEGAPSDEDVTSVRLRQDPTAIGGFVSGYGSSFQGGVDVTGDGVPDVIVAHTGRSTSVSGQDGKAVLVYDGQAIALAQGGDLRVGSAGATLVGNAWLGANGAVLKADVSGEFRGVAVIGNYDGWILDGGETADLVIADKGFSSVQVRYNHEVEGGAEVLGLFPYSEGNVVNPSASGMFSAAMWVDAAGDVDADGMVDVFVGTANGEVLIIH